MRMRPRPELTPGDVPESPGHRKAASACRRTDPLVATNDAHHGRCASFVAASLAQSFSDLLRYRSLLATLVSRDLKVRYKRSVLGVLWTMVNPLLMMIVFSIVFAQVFRFSIEHFTIYFLSAYLLWNFVAQTTAWSTACLLGNAPLIRKIYVPKAIFVLATTLSGLVNLVVSLVPLAGLMLIVGHPMRASLAFLPVAILVATAFTYGVSLLLAAVCIEFNDVVQIYQVWLVAWMYLTPVIYPLDVIPPRFIWIVKLNPMYYIVETFRRPVYEGVVPGARMVVPAVLSAVVMLVFGWWLFERRSDRIAYLV
jgi:homopolymeric O-antigen transport system permease protein